MKNFKKGFTLIEIVIVLAIAALIMVIVFLGVQGAQRSQRDIQAKDNASRLLSAANVYASNTSGAFPASEVAVDSLIAAPPAGYGVSLAGGGTTTYTNAAAAATGTFNVYNANCAGGTPGVAVRFYQESGGAQCIGN